MIHAIAYPVPPLPMHKPCPHERGMVPQCVIKDTLCPLCYLLVMLSKLVNIGARYTEIRNPSNARQYIVIDMYYLILLRLRFFPCQMSYKKGGLDMIHLAS